MRKPDHLQDVEVSVEGTRIPPTACSACGSTVWTLVDSFLGGETACQCAGCGAPCAEVAS